MSVLAYNQAGPSQALKEDEGSTSRDGHPRFPVRFDGADRQLLPDIWRDDD
jgi:hypothetical protein